MTAKLTDAELVQACAHGQVWAWEALLERYKRLIYSIPLQAGLGEEDAADVFQTVCTSLYEHLAGLRDGQSVAKWLITTTQRASWTVLRKRNREPASEQAISSLSEKVEDSPEAQASATIDRELLLIAMEHVGGRCRELLRLLYLDSEEPTYEQIAERLKMPVGSIGPTRARCLAKVRRVLESMNTD